MPQFMLPRTSTVVNKINATVSLLTGLVFGGPKRDILFVLSAADVIDLETGKTIGDVDTGPSLVLITGLNATGPAVLSRINI